MTAFDLAQRFVGEVTERKGSGANHPAIVWALDLCGLPMQPDETPWCSGFVNLICWLLRLPRSKSAAARSWLNVGIPVAELRQAQAGYDVVVLKRGTAEWQGHVGFFAGYDPSRGIVSVLGGNQSNSVTVADFRASDVLGVRRLKG